MADELGGPAEFHAKVARIANDSDAIDGAGASARITGDAEGLIRT
jgi:hypothetical protein